MKRVIEARKLSGSVQVPPSKSMSHRAVIAAALAEGGSRIDNLVFSDDIEATCDAIRAFGCKVERGTDSLRIDGGEKLKPPAGPIDCRESGSTLRFMIPFAGLVDGPVEFVGRGELPGRPLGPYLDLFRAQGIPYRYDGRLPLTVDGRLESGVFELPGNVSSQFVTGLLFVLPLLDGNSRIVPTSPLESADYIDLTLQAMSDFGVRAAKTSDGGYEVAGGQRYRPTDYRVEGDYSQAAFWVVAGLLGRGLSLLDLKSDSLQGDKRILDIAAAMGGRLRWDAGTLVVEPSRTRGAVVDAAQCPDLVPAVAALAAVSEGTTRIVNAARVRIKESDRLKAMATELNKLGAKVREDPDGLTIEGVERLSGGSVDGWNDHRIVMSLAVVSAKCAAPLIIEGSEAVRKSYPHFFEDFAALGDAFR